MAVLAAERRADIPLVLIAYFSFIVMGMPGAVIGVLWNPYLRDTFALPLDALGVFLLATSAGYFIASALTGRFIARLGAGTLFTAACAISMVSLLGIATSPSWTAVVAFAALVGVGTALQDAGLNIFFAARFNARLMNWLHACFGIGSMLAPILAVTLIQTGADWRTVYGTIAGLFIINIVLFLFTRSRWKMERHPEAAPVISASLRSTISLPIVWIGIGVFLLIGALEATTGNWSSSLSQSRGIDEATAGLWVSIYWGSFTVGRILFGALNLKTAPDVIVRWAALGAAAGAALLWWSPVDAADFLALIIIGFSIAPMFATLVTFVQARLGPRYAPNAIGMQVAAASIGFGVIPGIAGTLAASMGLEIIPPFIMAMALLFFALILLLRSAPVPADR